MPFGKQNSPMLQHVEQKVVSFMTFSEAIQTSESFGCHKLAFNVFLKHQTNNLLKSYVHF